jgi:hypothetical protein
MAPKRKWTRSHPKSLDVPAISDPDNILKQSKSLKKLGSVKLFLLPPSKEFTSWKEELVEP